MMFDLTLNVSYSRLEGMLNGIAAFTADLRDAIALQFEVSPCSASLSVHPDLLADVLEDILLLLLALSPSRPPR